MPRELRQRAEGRRPTDIARATVVIPLHNHAEWIGSLLGSLFAQWRPDLNLLLIDDASTDGSFLAALTALETRPDIPATLLRNEHARHHGLADQVVSLTPSPIIIKADSDDIALPGRLDGLLAEFDADPACRLVSSNAIEINEHGMPTGLYDVDEPDQVVDDPMRWASSYGSKLWLGATMAFHRTLITAFPAPDPELCPYGLDIVLAFRATLLGTHRHVARPLLGWRQHARNTHRVVGVLDPRAARRENYAAMESMAMAQRVRDARHARSLPDPPAELEAVIARGTETFFNRYDNWCRLRNRLDAAGGSERAPAARAPPVPPIAILGLGVHRFGQAGPLGSIAAAWNGFYSPEETWNWVSGAALIVFRVPPGVDRLVLTMAAAPWLEGQPAYVSVNFGKRVEGRLAWPDQLRVEVPVPGRWEGNCVVLLIEAPHARVLREINPGSVDPRRLGLMAVELELASEVSARPAGGVRPPPCPPRGRNS